MKRFWIKTLEYFATEAQYTVEAETFEEAVEQVKAGGVGYDWHEHGVGDDEWGEVLDWKEIT